MPRPDPLPDTRQREPHDCGTACLRCLWQYHHGQERRLVDLSTPADGLDPVTMRAQLHKLQWNVCAGTMTVDDLRHYTSTERPVICPITAAGGGHYVLVGGVYRGRVWYHCPVNGWSSMPEGEWESRWHDVSADGVRYWRHGIVAWPNNA